MKAKVLSILALLLTVTQGAWAQWTGGTYTATANENVSAISVTSDATLTINKGVTVTVNGGINATGHTLTVAGSGTLVVKGSNGNNVEGGKGGSGGNGGNGVTGNLIVDGANVTITGGNGGNGGNSEFEDGGNGGNGGLGVSGNVTVNGGSATINGGRGGNGGRSDFEDGGFGSPGSSALAYSGTLTLGANVTLYEGTNASGTVLDGNTGSSRVYSGAKKQNMYADTKVVVTSITFDPATASMTLGGATLTLTPTVLPADAPDKTVTWTTSDESVATVADGVVTAVAAGTATITATANDGSGVTGTCTVTVTDPATKYDLTVGENEHGTVDFTVGGAAATQAKKDDVVTVSVTPAEGYSAKDVTVRAYTTWAGAPARALSRAAAPELLDNITVNPGENGTWTFTMPEANVWVVVTYAKNLQDAWIQAIADQTYTDSAIEPTIEVKDGETTLTLNTDYTVAYSNNTNAGEATVTVTAVAGSDYSGTATKTFNIVKADITMTMVPAAVSGLVYSGEAQTLITAGVASFGTVLYSLDGTNFSDALPQGTDAGAYTVTYKVEGDDNHNAFAAQTLNVTIAKAAINPTLVIQDKTYDGQEITYTIENNPGGGSVVSISWEKEISENTWSSVSDTPKDAGKYRGTASIAETDNYQGATTTTAEFTISKATPVAGDFVFSAPAELSYDGLAKAAALSLVDTKTGAGDITMHYFKGGNEVQAPVAAGTYTVKIDVAEGDNFVAATAQEDDSWTFTITGPADGADITIALTEKYGTYCSAYDLDFSGATGLTAYIAAGYNKMEHTLLMVKVTSVPKHTGLLLKRDSEAGDTFTAKMITSSPYIYSNLLTGTTEETDVTTNDLILSKDDEGKIGFYRVKANGTIAANKAYLKGLASETGAPRLTLEFLDDATDIAAITSKPADANRNSWYTLDGRKLQGAPAKKGIYLLNGKKVVVR